MDRNRRNDEHSEYDRNSYLFSLYDIAYRFRLAIEMCLDNNELVGTLMLKFPHGSCSYCSELLQRFYMENEIETLYVTGDHFCPESHAWLETSEGIIIDITGDQYRNCQNEFFCDCPVYVGPKDSFHAAFGKCIKTPYIAKDKDPFDSFDRLEDNKEKDYEAILQRMQKQTH